MNLNWLFWKKELDQQIENYNKVKKRFVAIRYTAAMFVISPNAFGIYVFLTSKIYNRLTLLNKLLLCAIPALVIFLCLFVYRGSKKAMAGVMLILAYFFISAILKPLQYPKTLVVFIPLRLIFLAVQIYLVAFAYRVEIAREASKMQIKI